MISDMTSYKIIIDGHTIIPPVPDVVARIFAGMDSDQQATFFNTLVEIESEWFKDGGAGWPMQLQAINDSEELNQDARDLMEMIGEYAEKQS